MEKGEDSAAVRLFRPAAERGNPCGQLLLDNMLFTGRGVTRDTACGADLIKRAADSGRGEAQARWRRLLEAGKDGVTKGHPGAVEYLRRAADQCNPDGMAVCMNSFGVLLKDEAEAARLLRAVPRRTHADAQGAEG
jgi:TPR repeat protein